MTGPNLSGDDCREMETRDDEQFREAVEDRVAEAYEAGKGDVLRAGCWLYQNRVDGDDVDTAALEVLKLTLIDAGLWSIFCEWEKGPTTWIHPMFNAVKARHSGQFSTERFHVIRIDDVRAVA